ncbi:hypothetical protein DM02DRAFT_682847 [Periconia macrospinosa]|uniref:Uncharacterized protein n=1 Tax=Periconia macrospinosa TaxID=97972 RepID=A0A2V1E9H9_9PLEO|nr:hypothetical protein DM02DRAFT_682847 [Periconia macrospinosa]
MPSNTTAAQSTNHKTNNPNEKHVHFDPAITVLEFGRDPKQANTYRVNALKREEAIMQANNNTSTFKFGRSNPDTADSTSTQRSKNAFRRARYAPNGELISLKGAPSNDATSRLSFTDAYRREKYSSNGEYVGGSSVQSPATTNKNAPMTFGDAFRRARYSEHGDYPDHPAVRMNVSNGKEDKERKEGGSGLKKAVDDAFDVVKAHIRGKNGGA